MDKTYRDSDGNRVDLAVLCCREPGWATNRIKELTRQVEALVRGNDQMRLLAGLPLPPDVVAKLREADRLRKLFDDAGQGEHNVMTKWTDERPTEPGEYWVSIPPQRRMQYAHKCVVLPVIIKQSRRGPLVVGLIGTTGFWEVTDAQLDGAKWSRRETPADPFEEG